MATVLHHARNSSSREAATFRSMGWFMSLVFAFLLGRISTVMDSTDATTTTTTALMASSSLLSNNEPCNCNCNEMKDTVSNKEEGNNGNRMESTEDTTSSESKTTTPPETPKPETATTTATITKSTTSLEALEENMHQLCREMNQNQQAQETFGMIPLLYCRMFPLVYKRLMTLTMDRQVTHYVDRVNIRDHGHYQMTFEQYMAIVSTIMTIPHHGRFHNQPVGPSVLVIGCGADTVLWAQLLKYLGGTLDIVENDQQWANICSEKSGTVGAKDIVQMHVVDYPGQEGHRLVDHANALKHIKNGHDVPQEDSVYRMERDLVIPTSLLETPKQFDIIIVDGPDGSKTNYSPGRSESLFLARRLAESYPTNHYTHVFLHDTNRGHEKAFADAIFGRDPATYLGNVRPTKGLFHWRVPGKDVAISKSSYSS